MTKIPATLGEFAEAWADTPEAHERLYAACLAGVATIPVLQHHRDVIEQDAWGCGARAFHWLWHLLVQAHPRWTFAFLEIGVLRGATLSLISLLAREAELVARVVGVSTFDGRGMAETAEGWAGPDGDDYLDQVQALYTHLGLTTSPMLIRGDSTDPEVVAQVQALAPFDAVYIDGSHAYADARADLLHYAPMVVPGGHLLMDDASVNLDLPLSHYAGFPGPSDAADTYLPHIGPGRLPGGSQWACVGNVTHLRLWRRVA